MIECLMCCHATEQGVCQDCYEGLEEVNKELKQELQEVKEKLSKIKDII